MSTPPALEMTIYQHIRDADETKVALIIAAAIVSVAHEDQVAALGRVVILVLSGAGLVAFLWRLSRRD